jgi:hypothetical protein
VWSQKVFSVEETKQALPERHKNVTLARSRDFPVRRSILPARIWLWNVIQHVTSALDQLGSYAAALNQKYSGNNLEDHFKTPPQKTAGIDALRPGFEN